MAKKIGLKYPVYAFYSDVTGSPAYSGGAVMAKAISANVSWEKNDGKLHADDDIDELDNSVKSGTIAFELNQLSDAVQADLFGHKITDDGEVAISESDISPNVGSGYYGKVKVDGAVKWRTVWLPKVIFGIPNDETKTKGESIEYQTPSIEGTIMRDITGRFCYKKLHDTEAEARAYLNAKAGITPQLAKPEADVSSGTYAVAQTVELSALEGATIYYTTNGITPTVTTGEEYTTAIDITASCALKAIAVKEGSSNSEVATYEYIIQ